MSCPCGNCTSFAAELIAFSGASEGLIRAHADGLTRDELHEHIDRSRLLTDDLITDIVAVNLVCAMIAACRIEPSRNMLVSFDVYHSDTGERVEIDDVPADLLARTRMATALTAGDADAARDVWTVFRVQYAEQVTPFLCDTVELVYAEATRNGMTISRPKGHHTMTTTDLMSRWDR